jgi:hypothetical protein
METITIAKNNFKKAATYVLKCQIKGKLKIPISARWNLKIPRSNFIDAINAMKVSKIK